MYDVFVDYTAGVPALELVAWSSDTARATSLAVQNGVYVQTSDTDSLYVCSFRTTGVSGQTEDSLVKRYVWNYYNRVPRVMRVIEATNSWAYSTATWRQANAAAGNQLDYVVGVAEVFATVIALGHASTSTNGQEKATGIGYDSTSVVATGCLVALAMGEAGRILPMPASLRHAPAVGRHTYVWLEISQATATTTWYGDTSGTLAMQSGIEGEIEG